MASPLGGFLWREKQDESDILSIDAEKYIENHNILFREAIPDQRATSSKTIIKVQPGFVNISIQMNNTIKHVFCWKTTPDRYFYMYIEQNFFY